MTKVKGIKIQTNNVNIQKKTRGNKPKSRKQPVPTPMPQRPRGGASRRNEDIALLQPPIGIQTGLSEIMPSGPVFEQESTNDFSYQSKQFLENYSDPCGEHCQSLDAARVPDGALETSAGAFFRRLDTFFFPWQSAGKVSLDGETYSMLFYQPPLFRALAIVIAKRNDGELTQGEVDAFCVAWANIPNRDAALYPNWITVISDPNDQLVFTVMDAKVMRSVVPPNKLGVSEFVQSYRFSSQGMNIFFNTPDLLDQATVAGMRYVTDHSVKTFVEEPEVSQGRLFYFPTNVFPQVFQGNLAIVVTIGSQEQNEILPLFVGVVGVQEAPSGTSLFPSPTYTASTRVVNGNSSFSIQVGHEFRYEHNATTGIVSIVNLDNGDRFTLTTIPPVILPGTSYSVTSRLYEIGDDLPDTVAELDFTVMSLPPIAQTDEYQQNVKTAAVLAKETGGLYLPGCIYEPVFKVTSASDYRKILFTTPTVSYKDLIAPNVGWYDTVDSNFSTGVMNWQSVPYACKPWQKYSRSAELVPSAQSVVGLFTTGPPPEQPEVIDIAKAFSTKNAQGFPSNYNGMGILFGKILAVAEAIPMMLRSGQNIAREVGRVIDEEKIEESLRPPAETLLRGFKRLMARV